MFVLTDAPSPAGVDVLLILNHVVQTLLSILPLFFKEHLKNTRLPESSGGCSLLVKLLNLHCGSSGRLAWEPLGCGACVASPSTLEWAERDSQHSSSFHGRPTAPECSPPLSLFPRHRIPASTRMFWVFGCCFFSFKIKYMVNGVEIGFRWRSACSLPFTSSLMFSNTNVCDSVWQQYAM